ncbi:putative ubiquitin specific protease 39 isoform 2 [Besnoitia besnoiti]|uniref:Putative ubiquitin specific protease 39 isoform 2 n=1 Tax=Besnoitia besnoiti TaxID=94643 RepID=A0A2A9M7I2_BESBE|nr:putative ubiquitin specific protease 39 isoform 2 [Besnoitia besnoiti]PFH31607.1 putative ubiquitin specific protease 39 isoform 2 [Besnoitia besnoiti]
MAPPSAASAAQEGASSPASSASSAETKREPTKQETPHAADADAASKKHASLTPSSFSSSADGAAASKKRTAPLPSSVSSSAVSVAPQTKQLRRTCPYLGTIKRHLLDFDFEKVCCICLSNQHVYACLVCARYFQGRGKNTYAYLHALQEQHYVYLNLKDCRVYCLPDNYEVKDASLDDIIYNLHPTYTTEDVAQLSTRIVYGKALDGADYIPGCVGLNNLKQTDFCNVIIQALCTVIPLRNWLLLLDLSNVQNYDAVLQALGELMRKIFNARNFKGIVSPHEFLQAVGVASKKEFRIGEQADPIRLFCWLMTRVQQSAKHKKLNSNVVLDCFQGEVEVRTTTAEAEAQRQLPSVSRMPFLYLTLDLPQAPIFKDSLDRNMIPHIPIFDLLQKFNGEQVQETSPGALKRYSLWRLPKYLVLHVKRFSKNNFYVEKNPTIVTFPVKHLDLRDYVHEDAPLELNPVTKYDLVANICHQGKPHDGQYKVHVLHAPTNEWFEIEDLRVTQVLPQFVALSESYVQVYQRQDVAPDGSIDAAAVEAALQELRKKEAKSAAVDDEDIFAAASDSEDEEVSPAPKEEAVKVEGAES